MKIGPLNLFNHSNVKGTYVLASWHSPHSLTWSWSIWLSFERRLRMPRLWRWWANTSGQAGLVLPGVDLSLHWQKEMWFRDLYYRAREREDALERRLRVAVRPRNDSSDAFEYMLKSKPPAGRV